MPETLVRDAVPADRPDLLRFMAALQDFERAREANRRPGAEMAGPHLDALMAWVGEAEGFVLVAERAGRAAGFVLGAPAEAFGCYVAAPNQRHGQISDLWVEPEARRDGVARALVAAAEDRFRAAGLARVEVSALAANAGALALYRAAGYAPYEITLARAL